MEYTNDLSDRRSSSSPQISNVELLVLEIIYERGESSGYEIDRFVRDRGYRSWAGIGTTSIYVGLEKLRNKRLVEFYLYTEKRGRGPSPKKFKLTKEGEIFLKREVAETIASAGERDHRFDLALAGIPFLTQDEVIAAFQKRKEFLLEAARDIIAKFQSEGGDNLPLHRRAVFKHPLFLIKHEIDFTDSLIVEMRQH